jgi:hypothetical protein
MRRKRPHVASPDEVRITRKGETAIIEYADPEIWVTNCAIGPKLAEMTDAEVLTMWNDGIEATERLRREHRHVATEIPIGKPQIEKSDWSRTWVPRGDVLRCVVHDGGPDGEPIVDIDEHELSWAEFGQLLTTYAGWGMRLVFVPDDELHEKPRIRVREPKKKPAPGPKGKRARA